jgi:hypothetical protein
LFRFHESILARESKIQNGNVVLNWFDQRIDHYNAQDARTYKQRYYSNSDYYIPGGPIFVYIGGEGAIGPSTISSGEIVENAMSQGAMLYALEHRYYGLSQPFGDWSTPNMAFLSSQQALADLANFIEIQNAVSAPNQTAPTWFSWGGSYPGCLSAWSRMKFPHLTSGSVASSAPVLAKADYFEYDQAVAASANVYTPTCADTVRAATKAVESALDADPSLPVTFQCSNIADPVGFLYVLADAVAYSAQYTSDAPGPRYQLLPFMCDTLADEALGDPVERYRVFLAQLFTKLSTNCVDFTTTIDALQNTTIDENSNQRQWYYQSCAEFGFFQTAPAVNSLRSTRINLDFHLQQCLDAYGLPMVPNTAYTNAYYGGNQPAGTRVVFPNGSLDPWHVLSVLSSKSSSLVPILINGTSHCTDLHASSPTDSPALQAARAQVC